ncbi:hypothetical protein O6H91_07G072500 [Diphasiastrum complanatum]|uniref:Uncharacterized protein n=4 Tax=Diphasiastrum complanatum TaxID=34168 RepID=A0ACC2D6L9_DIPCM|nr:hypothetical protein O6H91_07G072500 [Diphasiastrum complanatum]KAJ7549867.1 hypothetical protein O6H91_07G072500 [Diphasiastrum complanatum]KAJ7549868.1 hypothetical protein O6H91_07G072500 [Diphasiastrum complanatum]KAJ7549869.1 hypothetical protein O6H91_07G072500 [Diphasiastrum complanatum]
METVASTSCPLLLPDAASNRDVNLSLQVKTGEEEGMPELQSEHLRHVNIEKTEIKNILDSRKRWRQEELQVDTKKTKIKGSFGREAGSVDATLGKAAEIILVLAGMGQMRAGRVPTSVETNLMKEAQKTLGSLISKVTPQDLMSNQLADSLIGEMKSRRELELKKELAAKRAEEEKKAMDAISEASIKAPLAAIATDRNFGTSELGGLANDGFFVRNVQHEATSSSGGSLDALGISAVKASAESVKHLLRVREEDTSESQIYKMGIDLFKLDSEIPDGQNIEAGQNLKESSASPPFQSTLMEGIGVDQQLNESQSGLTIHSRLVEIVQRLIPQSFARAANAVSNAYIASSVPCAICYQAVKDEASVLVCDGCEKAFHLKCLQPFYLKDIPEGDWYCPKCVVESGGRSQLPKYGPIHRSSTLQDPIRHGSVSQAGSKRHHAKSHARATVSQSGRITSGAVSHTLSDSVNDTHLQSSVDMQKNIVQDIRIHNTAQESISVQHAPRPEESIKRMTKKSKSEDTNELQAISSYEKSAGNDEEAHENASQFEAGNPSTSSPLLSNSAEIDPGQSNFSAESLVVARGALAGKGLTLTSVGTSVVSSDKVPDAISVEWAGDMLQLIEEKAYYAACRVGGCTFKLNDCALFRPETPDIPPYIARIQVLWEDIATGSKWVRVNWCYYPNDIPTIAGCPEKPEEDEVYESNHCDNNLVGSIQGPCKVLSPQMFYIETERRMKLRNSGVSTSNHDPIFLCRWLYDAPKGIFRRYFGSQ